MRCIHCSDILQQGYTSAAEENDRPDPASRVYGPKSNYLPIMLPEPYRCASTGLLRPFACELKESEFERDAYKRSHITDFSGSTGAATIPDISERHGFYPGFKSRPPPIPVFKYLGDSSCGMFCSFPCMIEWASRDRPCGYLFIIRGMRERVLDSIALLLSWIRLRIGWMGMVDIRNREELRYREAYKASMTTTTGPPLPYDPFTPYNKLIGGCMWGAHLLYTLQGAMSPGSIDEFGGNIIRSEYRKHLARKTLESMEYRGFGSMPQNVEQSPIVVELSPDEKEHADRDRIVRRYREKDRMHGTNIKRRRGKSIRKRFRRTRRKASSVQRVETDILPSSAPILSTCNLRTAGRTVDIMSFIT